VSFAEKDFLAALELWTTVEPYSSFPCQTINWRLLPAFEHGKACVFWREGRLVGFATWAFMTHEEYGTREYCGAEIFSREDGEVLLVVDLIVPGGKNDVLWVCRQLRRLFRERYEGHRDVFAHRGPRNGVFPNKGG
jgi:hemolysin-activating ACP:hemolysin acyltransferase